MIKSYLINLDKDTARLAFMHANFQRLGLKYERFAAIDQRTFSEAAYQQFMIDRPRGGKLWLRGQMGCFCSHYALWHTIAQGPDNYCAVFEDDVHIADDLVNLLGNMDSIPGDVDLIRLDTSTNRIKLSRQVVAVMGKRKLYRVESTSWCTGGYIIHRRAARRLLELPRVYHQPVDVLLFNYENSIIAPTFSVLQCYPALCVQDKHHQGTVQLGSNIEVNHHLDDRSLGFRYFINQLVASPTNVYQFLSHSVLGYRRIRFK